MPAPIVTCSFLLAIVIALTGAVTVPIVIAIAAVAAELLLESINNGLG